MKSPSADERILFQTRYGGNEQRLSELFLSKLKMRGYNPAGSSPLPSMVQRIPYAATIRTIDYDDSRDHGLAERRQPQRPHLIHRTGEAAKRR